MAIDDRAAEGGTGGLRHFGKRLLGGASLLSLAGMLQQGVGFLLLPVYTRYLSPEDYGRIEVLMVSVLLALMVVGQGMPPALLRQLAYVYADDHERGRRAAGTALLYVAVSGLLFVALATLVSGPLSTALFGVSQYNYLVVIGGALVALSAFVSVGSSVLLAAQKVSWAVGIGLAQFAVKLALNILLVVVLQIGFTGIIWSQLAGEVVGVALTVLMIRRQVAWRFNRAEGRVLRAYGVPLVAATVGYQVLSVSDRYVIRFLRPAAELGLYAVAAKFSTAFYLVVLTPLARMWEINGLELAREDGGKRHIARVANIYLAAGGLLCAAAIVVTEPVLSWLLPDEFLAAEAALGILVGGSVFYGLGEIFKVGLRVEGASKRIALIAAGAAVLNVALTFALVPGSGYVGAAVATMLSFAALAAACAVASRDCMPIPWDVPRLLWGAALLIAVCLVQPMLAGFDPGQRLWLRTWMFLAYLAATPLLVDNESRTFVVDWLRRLRGQVPVQAEGGGRA